MSGFVTVRATASNRQEGKGLREALLLGAEAAASARDHAVLSGRARRGTVLRLTKQFQTETGEVCTYAQGYPNSAGGGTPLDCLAPGPEAAFDDKGLLDAGGAAREFDFAPAAGVSARRVKLRVVFYAGPANDWTATVEQLPKAADRIEPTGRTEAYTLTCETPEGTVLSSQEVTVGRGQRLSVNPRCA